MRASSQLRRTRRSHWAAARSALRSVLSGSRPPNGSVVHTGFGRFGETPLTSLSSMPAGPYLDGLFTQSNFGIVTRATLWLVAIRSLQVSLLAFRWGARPLSIRSSRWWRASARASHVYAVEWAQVKMQDRDLLSAALSVGRSLIRNLVLARDVSMHRVL